MTECLFVSDLHGSTARFEKLFALIRSQAPGVVFLGGDLLPFGGALTGQSPESRLPFVGRYLGDHFRSLRRRMGKSYPLVAVILGNDDPKREEPEVERGEQAGLWRYLHNRKSPMGEYSLYGYACIPPTPFLLKDWERYDVSRFVDVGAVAPTAGWRTVPSNENEAEFATIRHDLEELAGNGDLARAVFLFHAPPYRSALDRADLEGRSVDQAPVDVHIGSIAIRRFIEERRPYLTLHGHVHESARLTGRWRERIGDTWCFGAAHDGPELAVVRFALENPAEAERVLI